MIYFAVATTAVATHSKKLFRGGLREIYFAFETAAVSSSMEEVSSLQFMATVLIVREVKKK